MGAASLARQGGFNMNNFFLSFGLKKVVVSQPTPEQKRYLEFQSVKLKLNVLNFFTITLQGINNIVLKIGQVQLLTRSPALMCTYSKRFLQFFFTLSSICYTMYEEHMFIYSVCCIYAANLSFLLHFCSTDVIMQRR